MRDALTFNYIDDCREFVNVLLIFLKDFPLFSRFTPDGHRLSILNNFSTSVDDDIDPDLNAYNILSKPSKYYPPAELNNALEKSGITKYISRMHISKFVI